MTDIRDHEIDRLNNQLEKLTNREVELLRENRELRKRNDRLDKGYYRVKAERDKLSNAGGYTTEQLEVTIKNLEDTNDALSSEVVKLTAINDNYREQLSGSELAVIDALSGEINRLIAINDNLTEQLKHYKAIAGLNEPGF